MPKLLVVFQADDRLAESLANSAAEGARSVRFMEVEMRVTGGESGRTKPLGPAQHALGYDGIVLVSGDTGTGAMEALVRDVGATNDVVFAAVGAGASTLAALCVTQGGIVVGIRDVGDEHAQAKAIGARAAKVAGWVRHALGHEAEHQHGHTHDASHKHDHEH